MAISEATIGYQLLQKKYELTCLNPKCLKYKEPLHNLDRCPFCQQKTKRAELSWLLDEPSFTEPLTNQLNTICTKIELKGDFYQHIQLDINTIKQKLKQRCAGRGVLESNRSTCYANLKLIENPPSTPAEFYSARERAPRQHSPNFVWEYPIEFMVLHSFGHLVLSALPLLRMGASSDLNFLIDSNRLPSFIGYFYDTNEGGNGASETVWRFLQQLANKGATLATQCNCTNGCPRCLHHTNCPDLNQGLLKQLGIAACKLITAEVISKKEYTTF